MSNKKVFVSGDEAVAMGARLARPHVVAAYPITPQTIVVERLSEMVEDGSLEAEFMHVESEHSAMSAAIGASSVGARTFTATSSQGLLYMAEGLHYASGGRFPVVMMNANRSVALPWSIFGDLRDSLSQLDSGWIQVYVEDAQEALDMTLQAFRIAEDQNVLTPFMVNLDGFVLTHTYEEILVPEQQKVDAFLPAFKTPSKMSMEAPMNMGFSSSPADNMEFKFQQHKAMMDAIPVIESTDKAFGDAFGRYYNGMVDTYLCDDAEVVLVTVGSITGTARVVVDAMRGEGKKVGLLKLRYMRPFPVEQLQDSVRDKAAVGVLDKDISFGMEGTIYTNINSAMARGGLSIPTQNFIAGMGGRNISRGDIRYMFDTLLEIAKGGSSRKQVEFVNMGVTIDE
ncbi:MAG: pyruvate ferredoxin oxidoreductase [Bacteroidota bacterium]